jgi:hypothetical protein
MMKASEIKPTGWLFGINKPKTGMLMRKWEGICKSTKLMENTMLELINNPETTQEQLVLASKLYINVTKQLHNHAQMVDDYIYVGTTKVYREHMRSCPAYKTGEEDDCLCKDWEDNNVS